MPDTGEPQNNDAGMADTDASTSRSGRAESQEGTKVLDYDGTMATGQAAYQDVLDHLAADGLHATFTQTGGLCAALEVALEAGHTLLITDAEGPLSWGRAEHSGWGVGLYGPRREETRPLAFDCTCDPSLPALLPVVRSVVASSRRLA